MIKNAYIRFYNFITLRTYINKLIRDMDELKILSMENAYLSAINEIDKEITSQYTDNYRDVKGVTKGLGIARDKIYKLMKELK